MHLKCLCSAYMSDLPTLDVYFRVNIEAAVYRRSLAQLVSVLGIGVSCLMHQLTVSGGVRVSEVGIIGGPMADCGVGWLLFI